jgi:hypothetical protein
MNRFIPLFVPVKKPIFRKMNLFDVFLQKKKKNPLEKQLANTLPTSNQFTLTIFLTSFKTKREHTTPSPLKTVEDSLQLYGGAKSRRSRAMSRLAQFFWYFMG